MGQAAEDLEHLQWCQSMPASEINPHGYRVDPEWTTRSGKKVRLSKMETSHIKNCIRVLERKPSEASAHNIRILKQELERRGEKPQ
jgi:hypothetical protein